MKILSEFPITDFQIEIRPKMTPNGQISWPLRVCLVDPSSSRGNCGNIKSWFQSNIFQAMRTVLTNYCDTKKQNHVIIPHDSGDMSHVTMTLHVKIYIHILYHCLWKGYDLSDLSHHRLGFRQEKSLIDQWNSMFLNGFDLEISITLILLNNLQCLQPSLSLDSLWFWLKHESALSVLFWTPYKADDYSILS